MIVKETIIEGNQTIQEGCYLPPYKEMYLHLFNTITDALRLIAAGDASKAVQILAEAQQWGEDRYLEAEE